VEARLQLAATLPEVARMNAWLSEVLAGEEIPDPVFQDVKLCLNELVANIVLYGYPDGSEGRIDLTLDRMGPALAVRVEDDGVAFDPLSVPLAEAMTGPEDARIGGFGIKLFREAAHSARYVRSGGRNRLSFVCG
jgi:anti-sigma regulatory factor (Ser/Thr protein kinase)